MYQVPYFFEFFGQELDFIDHHPFILDRLVAFLQKTSSLCKRQQLQREISHCNSYFDFLNYQSLNHLKLYEVSHLEQKYLGFQLLL